MQGQTLITAESCTGGLISAALTDIPGSSSVFHCGFVTYSNASKTSLLGVPDALILEYGAVSQDVAEAMAMGARHKQSADASIAVTGIAGPGGGSAEKPVGSVWIATTYMDHAPIVTLYRLNGDRVKIREQATISALNQLLTMISR